MAHRAPGSAHRPSASRPSATAADAGAPSAVRARWADARRRSSSPLVGAIAAEAEDVVAIARRVVPNRRAALLVGLALLALFALGGMAGAAEPKPADRSALDAFAGSGAPAASPAPQRGASALTLASVAPAGLGAQAVSGLAAGGSATTGVSATSLADDPAFRGPDLFDLGAKTALVLALLFVTLRVLRRVQGAGPTRGSGLLAVLESRSLGPKTQLHLVAVGDRRLVIGQSPAGLVALGELDAAELPVAEPVREPWARHDAQDEDPELEAQAVHELANGRRTRLGISA